jgi:hypothetical protein
VSRVTVDGIKTFNFIINTGPVLPFCKLIIFVMFYRWMERHVPM